MEPQNDCQTSDWDVNAPINNTMHDKPLLSQQLLGTLGGPTSEKTELNS